MTGRFARGADSARRAGRASRLAGLASWAALAGAAVTLAAAPPVPSGPAWGGIERGSDAGLRVTPTRIVFEGGVRSAELTLVNTGAAAATYRVALVRMRMSERGAIDEVQDALPGEACAESLLRFSPRQVELEPGATQTVRIQVRRPADLPAGEYRSHLVFRGLPPVSDTAGAARARGVRIALQPVFGLAIPVIVRQGETHASVTLGDLALVPGDGTRLALTMRRTGNRSAYGDLTVTHTPPGGRPRVVGRMRGLAVYVPNPVRIVEIPLQLDPRAPIARGTFHATYTESVGEAELLAEAELAFP